MQRLIVGCPVANRAWSLPYWFECLAAQTRRPDGFAFVHSGHVGDDTWIALQREAARHGFRNVGIHHDVSPPHPRHDNERYRTLALLRNRMITLAAGALQADLLLSLDTDIMLENPATIETLVGLVEQGYDIATPVTFLHPAASDPDTDAEIFWAYNAGWWAPGGRLDDPRRAWLRPAPDSIEWGAQIEIQVPMAVWLGNAAAMRCRYRWHEGGEDLGYAQDVDEHGLRVIWDTSLKCQHVWCETDMHAIEARSA